MSKPEFPSHIRIALKQLQRCLGTIDRKAYSYNELLAYLRGYLDACAAADISIPDAAQSTAIFTEYNIFTWYNSKYKADMDALYKEDLLGKMAAHVMNQTTDDDSAKLLLVDVLSSYIDDVERGKTNVF